MRSLTATYSPDDNKLRLYSTTRLDTETYERVRAAGFKYAPKQDLFVAPAWTPSREDLLLELCGEIDDEDTTLVERAEARAERFGEYSDRRADDAEDARAAVASIADNIPFGQPILIGHHSEGRARRDAERIQNGMRRTVSLWKQSEYWQERARAALQHARYKESPAVRARRIRKLESEHRGHVRERGQAERSLGKWTMEGLSLDEAKAIANVDSRGSYCFPLDKYPRQPPASQYEGRMGLWSALDGGIITPEQAAELATGTCRRVIAWSNRWIAHLDLRLAYERAMLEDQGGIASDRTKPEMGGACQCWASPGHGRGWSYIVKVNRVSVTVYDNWGNGGGNFTRTIPFDKLRALMTKGDVDAARASGTLIDTADGIGFYLRAAEAGPDPEAGTPDEHEPAAPVASEGTDVTGEVAAFPSEPASAGTPAFGSALAAGAQLALLG